MKLSNCLITKKVAPLDVVSSICHELEYKRHKRHIFSIQPQFCLTFYSIEPQMFLKCCLLIYIDIILSRQVAFWLFAFMPAPSPIHVLCDLFFIAIFISITINHTTSLKKDTCFLEVFVGSSASLKVFLSFCLFFVNFSLALFINVLLLKKLVYQ